MIKRMTLLQRRQAMSTDEFDVHWAGPHADIARDFPRLARYNQNSVRRRPDEDAHGLDGIVELWFADAEAMAEALASPVAARLPADEPNFLSGITILSVRPEVLQPGKGPAKVMVVADLEEPHLSQVTQWAAALPANAAIAGIVVNHIESVGARSGLATLRFPPSVVAEFVGSDADLLWHAVGAAMATLETSRSSAYSVVERRIV